ncbi:MAG TPA: DAK2 domain-containing protein [Candidatus Limnocylindria bacterium]|nr:DAK2 domain-containing protein [Candidatus Limnocylindria bacterium]
MSDRAWEGVELLAALRQSAATLRLHVDEVNALNVFPVPDGDTGSNMLATIQAAVEEGAGLDGDDSSLAQVSAAISLGALMGARGNSGVILSQLFRGMSEELQSQSQLDGASLAAALQAGCSAAFSAVAKPVEGTILTVAREAAEAAGRAAKREKRLEPVLSAAVEAAAAAVEATPTLLPILRQAQVVDAGGRGLELVLRGALAYARGEQLSLQAAVPHEIVFPAFEALEEDGFGYETVFVVTPQDEARLDVIAIRNQLEELGESVLVAGDDRAVKVHVHNERPDEIIAYGLSLGTLSRIVVENLDRQAHERRQGNGDRPSETAAAVEDQAAGAGRSIAAGPGVVAVAPGDGLERVFLSLGARVVRSENGVNSSAGELAEAIRATGCQDVLVLPNHPNVRLAASQGGDLCPDQNVAVVATRNAAEGVAALLALDEDESLAGNAKRMLAAARAVHTLQVAEAVRDARLGRRRVRRGQHIVLRADGKLLAADDERQAAILRALQGLKSEPELITLYHGEGSDDEEARALAEAIAAAYASTEVEVVEGGQHHYSFLISAE